MGNDLDDRARSLKNARKLQDQVSSWLGDLWMQKQLLLLGLVLGYIVVVND